MPEINLLKNQLKDRSAVWVRRNRLIVSSLFALIILEITAGVLLLLFKQSITNKKQEITDSNIQIQSSLNEKQKELVPAKAFQAQLKNLTRVVDSHVYWTAFFDELSAVTLKKVRYTQLQADSSGKVYLEGRVDTYTDLGKLLLGLSTSKSFSNVRLLSSSPESSEVGGLIFSLDLNINPELLLAKQ
ncbi:MAG: PilN domain-containing protein [Candidatus Doudnabacteria bacterium]|nr:PilN domain-containing protein [Candidatus Doudnabacteria bacterium]